MADTVTRDPLTSEGMRVIGGRAQTQAVGVSELEHSSQEFQLAFSWVSGTYDPAAGDTILLVKNISDDDLHIESIELSSDVATRVIIHFPSAEITTPAGTEVFGINLNRNGANDNDARTIAKRDETTNALGDTIWAGRIGVNNPKFVDMKSAVILKKNESIAVDYAADVGACDVVILGHFE